MSDPKEIPQTLLLTQSKASDGWVMMKPVKSSTVERAERAGITLAAEIKERTGKAIVLSHSEECVYVERGDKVIHLMYAPAEVELDGDKFLMVQEKDIIAIYDSRNNPARRREVANEDESKSEKVSEGSA